MTNSNGGYVFADCPAGTYPPRVLPPKSRELRIHGIDVRAAKTIRKGGSMELASESATVDGECDGGRRVAAAGSDGELLRAPLMSRE